jgi:pimeloyl-ACP methyl ester carboxylesterase/DNA-binding CsgD family transcriptional regulator
MKQTIRYLRTSDGISLAWAHAGRGPALARASNWLTHLEYDWQSPVWRHWTEFFASHFHYIRYDERGCGMTDRQVGEQSCERWVADFEAVIDASAAAKPLLLFGVSQGAAVAIEYAVRHPENVTGMILYGGYAVGAKGRDNAKFLVAYNAMQELVRIGWDKDNPVFRQLFTSRFIPDGTSEQIGWFNDLCRRTTSPEIAYSLLAARAEVDIREALPRVSVPTLVLHADGDEVVPVSEGRRLASDIPGAEFVSLASRNHVLLAHEAAWLDFKDAVLAFAGISPAVNNNATLFAELSRREREVYALLCGGHTNAASATKLRISEKTVRNHLSSVYGRLGVHSRVEALVLARDPDFPS